MTIGSGLQGDKGNCTPAACNGWPRRHQKSFEIFEVCILQCVGIAGNKRATDPKPVASMVAVAWRKPSSSELVNGSLVQQGWKHCQ
ncbi:hypothetical protein OsI_38909 [Oryza sativa Indica Group]|uniref:Uncharacterized protein n=1 Tax=Oryza sativa subsp. indica TaxID=39946 RepID=B8BMR2_ORYSI|nr:hypothetical protein OsI_38909 [Oryza sativa Indica Group]